MIHDNADPGRVPARLDRSTQPEFAANFLIGAGSADLDAHGNTTDVFDG